MRPESPSSLTFPTLVGLVLGAQFPGAPALAAAPPPAKAAPAPKAASAGGPAIRESAVPASGFGLLPAYLARTGEVDATLEGVVANYTTAGQTFAGLQLASFTKLPRDLEAVANLGATLELGVRGPLWREAGVVLGWDARYRAEPYPSIAQGPGLTPALLGAFPGTQSHGLRLALEGMYPWRGFTFHADPLINVMANRPISYVQSAKGNHVYVDRNYTGPDALRIFPGATGGLEFGVDPFAVTTPYRKSVPITLDAGLIQNVNLLAIDATGNLYVAGDDGTSGRVIRVRP